MAIADILRISTHHLYLLAFIQNTYLLYPKYHFYFGIICQEGGLPTRTGYCIRFPRDHNDTLCLNTHEDQPAMYNDVPEKLTFKYGKETRFCLGVAAVEIQAGVIKGVKCKSFSYTGITLVSIKNWTKSKTEEFKRIPEFLLEEKVEEYSFKMARYGFDTKLARNM